MSKLLAKLTFVLTVTAAVGFYYLAAAPPTLAQVSVCGAGNFSDACPSDGQPLTSTSSPLTSTSSQPIDVYTGPVTQKVTSVPEPSTVIALLITGGGIIFSGRKRKNITEER